MLKRAGYIQLNRKPVISEEGTPIEILEIYIGKDRFGIRLGELRDALYAGALARVDRIQWNWMAFIGASQGDAQVSKSGKALNIELFGGQRFTIALEGLQAVLCCREKFAPVAVLPPRPASYGVRDRRITDYSPLPARFGPAGKGDGVPA